MSDWKDPIFKLVQQWLATDSPGPAKRVCFSGEYDWNQTDFEVKSNHLEIGVIANTDIEGRVMLAILRVIIDDNPYCMTDYKKSCEENTDDLWSYLERRCGKLEVYFSSFDIDSPAFTCTLYNVRNVEGGSYTINKNFSQVDLWTRKRLLEELTRVLKKHFQYENL